MEKTKEKKQIIDRTIGGVKFKYKQAYSVDSNNKEYCSRKQVKKNLDACQKAYLNAIG